MVLDNVSQRADFVVEAATAFNPEGLGHRDLHAVDVVAVPDGFEDAVRESEHHQVLDWFLAEEVIDSEDRLLGEMPLEGSVERSC